MDIRLFYFIISYGIIGSYFIDRITFTKEWIKNNKKDVILFLILFLISPATLLLLISKSLK